MACGSMKNGVPKTVKFFDTSTVRRRVLVGVFAGPDLVAVAGAIYNIRYIELSDMNYSSGTVRTLLIDFLQATRSHTDQEFV